MQLSRIAIVSAAFLAAVGIALARGRKAENEVPPAPAPTVEAAPAPVEPLPPPAPALFAEGVPVVLDALPPGIGSLSAQGCNACHYAAHDTWATSRHAQAWASPTYQDALRSAGGSTACVGCHLPVAAQHDQLAAGYVDGDLTRPRLEANPSFDLTLRGEGVTCAACHVRNGTILGVHEAPDAPHPVVVSKELRDPKLCATCHQLTWPEADAPFYDTYGEWERSSWAAAGVTCQDCHMAPTAGAIVPGTDGTLPAHTFLADPARAISALVGLPSASVQRGQEVTVTLTVQNTGAGHAFPTGSPFSPATLEVALVDKAGKDLAPPWRTVFGRTVELAPPWRTTGDTRLPAGGQWSGSHAWVPSVKGPAGPGAVEVRLDRRGEKTVLRRVPVEVR